MIGLPWRTEGTQESLEDSIDLSIGDSARFASLALPEGTAKSRLRLGLAKLETYLDRSLMEPT